jgi:methionine-rich copper-binding protein CopC
VIHRTRAALLLAGLTVLASAAIALGHAELVESDPPDGGTVETPYTLTANFDEPLEPNSSIVIQDAGGDEVAAGGVDPDDATVLVAELPELPAGEYRARWTATSADGHSERGTFTFTVAASPSPSPSPSPTDTPTVGANDLLLALLLAAAAIGGVILYVFLRGRR